MPHASSNSVLMVDDDARLLDGFRRQYHKALQLTTALGGEEGLVAVRTKGPFAVVVSDYQMPGMNGVTFLSKVRETDPDAVRVMLTGNADLQSAIHAVNDGHVFRFLTKPCSPEAFQQTIRAALEQYHLRIAERQLLEGTLKGSLEVMAELLGLANSAAFGRATRLREYVSSMVKSMGLPNGWRFEAAAMLSQIGCVAIPMDVIERVARGEALPAEQERMVNRHPEIARDLIGRIPRLESVADMIACQRGEGIDKLHDPEARLGARILASVIEFDELISVGAIQAQAVEAVRRNHVGWERSIADALAKIELAHARAVIENVPVRTLRVGMILDADVMNVHGVLLMARGFRLNAGTLERLRNYAQLGGVVEPIRVMIPPPPAVRDAAA